MPRLFTGLPIPADVALDLQIMQGGIPGARWMESSQFHLTLRFIGDVDGGMAREISESLEALRSEGFSLSLKGLGLFGGNKPHSIYAGVAENEQLRRLHDAHERCCRQLGLPPEHRKFMPHVTLARLKNPEPLALQRWIEVHSLYRSSPFYVDGYQLFSSRPIHGGGPYGVEAVYPLGERSTALIGV
jgi:RNA 2',3'-cyclic 3'-phosphodiesterase